MDLWSLLLVHLVKDCDVNGVRGPSVVAKVLFSAGAVWPEAREAGGEAWDRLAAICSVHAARLSPQGFSSAALVQLDQDTALLQKVGPHLPAANIARGVQSLIRPHVPATCPSARNSASTTEIEVSYESSAGGFCLTSIPARTAALESAGDYAQACLVQLD